MPPLRLFQASSIPYRGIDSTLEVLLITSTGGRRWILPKGIIEIGQTPRQCALAETEEEAGVTGTVAAEPVAEYEYRKWGGLCHVRVYPLEVTHSFDIWPERAIRERRWVPADDAEALLSGPGPQHALRAFLLSMRN